MTEKHQATLLVTGASGHLGRRVVELLLEMGAGQIIAASRTPEKLEAFGQRGVVVRKVDFDDPTSLVSAFAGVDRLLLISTDAVDKPGRRLSQHTAAIKAAEAAGIKHVIYTSLTNPGAESPVLIAPDHRGTEEALAASQMGWTILRNNIYTEGLISALGQASQMGKLFSAAGDGKAAYVTRDDCARAAAAALSASFSGRRTLDITGPQAVSQTDLAKIASTITGKQVVYHPVEPEVLIQNFVAAGLPLPVANLITSFDVGIAQGKFEGVSKAVEELTLRKAESVLEFLSAQQGLGMPAEGAH